MKQADRFHEYVVGDLLAHLAGITSRAMFGGYGIYRNGKIFALIADGNLFFKARSETKAFFEKNPESHPFQYSKKDGKVYSMSYWLVPESVQEDRELLDQWVAQALSGN